MENPSEVTSVASCWRCHASTSAMLCPACGAPQPLPADTDHFALLAIPRTLVVDPKDIERRYHALSRGAHPDRHQAAEPRARQLSIALAAELNRAYRTLRDPVARGRYWLTLHGSPLGANNNHVPPSLAALVFETQEELELLRAQPSLDRRGRIASLHAGITARMADLEAALTTRYVAWGAGEAASHDALQELRVRLTELAYLGTLAEDVEAALEPA